MVSIIIPHYGPRVDLLDSCLAAVEATTDAEVIVVDNGTGEASTTDILISLPLNIGFARACNLGAKIASSDRLCFLNNDAIVQPGWLEAIVNARGGVVGARLVYPDGTLQHSGADLELRDGTLTAFNRQDEHESGPVPAVTGALMCVETKLFRTLGGFDESYWNGYEDIDLCLRARDAGARVWYAADATAVHHESMSGPERWSGVRENVLRLHERWVDRWQTLSI